MGKGKVHGGSHHHHDGRSMSKLMSYNYMWSDETMATQQEGHSATFNVLAYGAKGDGRTDDTKVIISLSFYNIGFDDKQATI